MSYFSLLEDFRQMSILFEGIDDMRKYYKNIPENEFISYIELDPTYKQGSNKAGTYAKWILGLANNNNLKDKNHVKDLLSRYEENKKYLKDKDIMKFKSMDELESYLNDDDNYNDLSHRQEVRQRQKDRRNADLNNEAELVYEDSDWEVWIPKTYAASCKLGQGTRWCTASTETSGYYDKYTRDGNLHININKHNPEEKYQFHFESESYMDKDDEEISINRFFLNNELLYNNYYYKLYKFDLDKLKQQVHLLQENGGVYEYNGHWIPYGVRDHVKKVIVVNGVTKIDDNTFSDCDSLTSIDIPDSVETICDRAFRNCSSLTKITIPDSVTFIGDSAFLDCSRLTSVKIGGSVESIGVSAFGNCSRLTSVEIGSSVTSIYQYAFVGCDSLTSVYITNLESWCSIEFDDPYANPLWYAGNLYLNNEIVTELTIPNTVTEIEGRAFQDYSSLVSVVIPDSVTSIGSYAFAWCGNLTSVVISDSVTEIGNDAFLECKNLSEIKYTGSARQWKQIKKGENWAKGVPVKSIKLVDSVGIDENFKRRNKHIQ